MAKNKEVATAPAPAPAPRHESVDICGMLFKLVNKPPNYMMCNAINIYENKYRINVYTKVLEDGYEKQRMYNSYFAKLSDTGSLEILMQGEPLGTKIKKYKM